MMHIVIIGLYVSSYVLCSVEAVSGNGSVFHARKLKFDTSTSLSCWGISCRSDLEAVIQCHTEAGCMATWVQLDGNNNTMCSSCVCMGGGTTVNELAGATLLMKDFGKYIPGNLAYSFSIEAINDRCVTLITFLCTIRTIPLA